MKHFFSSLRPAAILFTSSALIVAFSLSISAQQAKKTATPIYKDASAPIEKRIADLLSRMTLEEKVRQLDLYSSAKLLVDKHSDETHAAPDAKFLPDKAEEAWGTLGAGGIHDLYPSPALANDIQKWAITHSRLGIPALFIEEGLHGFDTGTVYPAPLNLAATWDPTLAQQTAAGIAAETRATGVHMILAPVLDLAREPRWGRIEEDFGEDPYLTGQMGLAYVRGAQGTSLNTDHNVIAEPKHFAGHGSPEGGTNTSPVHMGERELRSIMLKSFEPAFREGHAMSVMAAYHEIDGVPLTADSLLFETILRKEWGFHGFVLSDLGAIERLYTAHRVAPTPKDAVCLANRSGVDMQFYDFPHDVFQQALIDCVKEGSIPASDFDYSVRAILRVKFMLGLFDHPYVDPSLNERVHRAPEHLAVSLQSARESMTLLKNDNNTLPLAKTLQHIAIIGPNAAIARYGDYEKEENGKHISIVQGVSTLLPQAKVETNDGSDIAAAVALANNADTVILALGEYQGISGEGFDRSTLDLPGTQEQLLEAVAATGKPVVLVLQNGRPLTIGWAKAHIPAILEAWYPGEFGGQAIAETLFGDNNPGGKLTITFPRSLGQLPVYYNADPSRVRKYVDDDGQPLFVFGHGLSYTTFTYSNIVTKAPAPMSKADVEVTVDVTNNGTREGDEVAQLYMRQDYSSVETPERALKGFSRVHLKAGETKTITFRVPQRELEIWNMQKKWVVEPGQYTFWAGGSSDAALTAKIAMQP